MFRPAFPSLHRHHLSLGLGALLLTMAGSALAAPAPPTPMPVVVNDGYVTVSFLNDSSGNSFSSHDKVCPEGVMLNASFWGGQWTCNNGKPPVSVQTMLDMKFGTGRAQAIGYAPNAGEVTVFYRFVTPSR